MRKEYTYDGLVDSSGKPIVIKAEISADEKCKSTRTEIMNYAVKMSKYHRG